MAYEIASKYMHILALTFDGELMTYFVYLLKFLKRPSTPRLAAVLSVILTLPALFTPLELDDLFHRAIFLKYDRSGFEKRKPQEMFRFLKGDESENQHSMDAGFLPWWTDKKIKAEFLQFLTVQTHVLDYALWPRSPILMHAHSLLWLALVVLLAGYWHRQLLPSAATAGLAAVLFAMEDAHGTPAGWICNRNVLVACAFGIASLLCHHKWRGEGRGRSFLWAPAAWFFFACSLLSKEEGLATSAYLGAYAFFLDRASRLKSLASLLPYTVIVFLWRGVRDSLGYGISHIGLYIDPVDQPIEFFSNALERLPVFVLGQLGLPPSEVYFIFKGMVGPPLMLVAILFIIFLCYILFPLLLRSATMRFSLCGMLLAMIPVCATLPSDRLLVFPSLGAMSLIAETIQTTLLGAAPLRTWPYWRRGAVLLSLGWLFLHGILSPFLLLHRAANPLGNRELSASFYPSVPEDVDLSKRTVVMLSAPSAIHAGYLPVTRDYSGLSSPDRVRCLASTMSHLHIRRADDRTLIVRAENGFIRFPLDGLFRNERNPLRRGDKVNISGLQASVLDETADLHPLVMEFRFDKPLEDEEYYWIYWRAGEWVTFPLPKPGEECWIDPPNPLDLVFTNWSGMPQGVRLTPNQESKLR